MLGVEVEARERRAGADAELPEDIAEVEVDRAWAEEELSGHLPIREALRDETGDLELLLGEVGPRARVPLSRRLAARPQLDPRALRPQRRSERLEGVESRTQVLHAPRPGGGRGGGTRRRRARCGHARTDGRPRRARRAPPRRGVRLRSRPPRGARGSAGPPHAGQATPLLSAHALEDVEKGLRAVPVVHADGSFDPIERTPEDDHGRGDLSTAPQGLLRPTESQLQQCQRPLRKLGNDPKPASRGELPTLGRQRPALVLRPSRGLRGARA